MNNVVIATTTADATAVEAVRSHHAELAGGLASRLAVLLAAARSGQDISQPRADLVGWCRSELLPHARAEEEVLYAAAQPLVSARMLVEAMVAEHHLLGDLIDQVEGADDPVTAAGAGTALQQIFDSHVTKENDQLLPLLAEAPGVSLADLLGAMHAALEQETEAADGAHAPACGCGEHDPAEDPELDARTVPHKIRHATIFGALDAVGSGAGLVLIAPHDPLPLLAQLERRSPNTFDVSYLQRGPETWRLRFARR